MATLLVLAWKTGDWWGVDRWLLPLLGTPWRPDPIFHDDDKPDTV
jgi:thiosulfate dehydrogenase [quinone] large subunit